MNETQVQQTLTEQPGQPEQPERTFTQKELDEIVSQRLARERKGQPPADELEEFRKWREDRKSGGEKSADELRVAKDAQSAAEQKAAELEAKFTAVKKGVSAEAAEDVVALAKVKVSDTVTLEQAIDEVLKKYPQFGGVPVTTGAKINNGSGSFSGVEKRFLEKNPNIKI